MGQKEPAGRLPSVAVAGQRQLVLVQLSGSKGRAVHAADTQNQPEVGTSGAGSALGQEGRQGSGGQRPSSPSLALRQGIAWVTPGPGSEVGSTGMGGDASVCFGKRTCVTGPGGLRQILLPTVVAWGAGEPSGLWASGSGL